MVLKDFLVFICTVAKLLQGQVAFAAVLEGSTEIMLQHRYLCKQIPKLYADKGFLNKLQIDLGGDL